MIDGMEVEGGTEILQVVQKVAEENLGDNNLPKHIYLLTDGSVYNTEKVVETIKDNSHKFTLHSFGLGNSVSTDLILKSARAGRGMSYFIEETDDSTQLESKIINAMTKVFEPRFSVTCPYLASTDKRVVLEYPELTSAPQLVYHGECFVYTIIYNQKPSGDTLRFKIQNESKIDGLPLGAKTSKFINFTLSNVEEVSGISIFKMASRNKAMLLQKNDSSKQEVIGE